jgi:hypothetical protein
MVQTEDLALSLVAILIMALAYFVLDQVFAVEAGTDRKLRQSMD